MESLETIRQNLTSVQQLMKTGLSINEFMSSESFHIFGYNQRKLVVGQWIDVKDTIEQWVPKKIKRIKKFLFIIRFFHYQLEAQVLCVRGNYAQVHYNGWVSRWDEWIDMNSPRIAPFR